MPSGPGVGKQQQSGKSHSVWVSQCVHAGLISGCYDTVWTSNSSHSVWVSHCVHAGLISGCSDTVWTGNSSQSVWGYSL